MTTAPGAFFNRACRLDSRCILRIKMASFTGENLSCIRGERLVLEGINFALEGRGAMILTGPNGAGKSTLLRLMAGLMRPSQGRLLWNDISVSDDATEHNCRISYVGHADAVKPALSVSENVGFWAEINGSKGHTPEQAMTSLGIVHLADLSARYLSAGQRRRVNLCRMLTSGADLWLLDEPTTALDSETSASLGELIAVHRNKGGMVVISTHIELGISDAVSLPLEVTR
jgi:heme exporter protein A